MSASRLARLLVVACAALVVPLVATCREKAPAPAAAPEQFPHARHWALQIPCLACHAGAAEQDRAGMPSVKSCALCHRSEEPSAPTPAWLASLLCSDVAVPWRVQQPVADAFSKRLARRRARGLPIRGAGDFPAANIVFPHSRHVALPDMTCATCHVGMENAATSSRDHAPPMETCLACHDGVKAKDACTTCHLPAPGGTIQTAYATGQLKPDDHGAHWLKQHEIAAERDPAACGSCHAVRDCLSCHDGALPPRFHDADYLALHPQDGYANQPQCSSCHRIDEFCRDCHVRARVTLRNPLRPSPNGNFHPAGWRAPGTPGPEHHATVARKNVSSCMSCHEQRDCVTCHAWSEIAPRTHPPGWLESGLWRRLREANFGACTPCHSTRDPLDPYNQP